MARQLDAHPPANNGRKFGGRTAKWNTWADGTVWELSLVNDLGYELPPITQRGEPGAEQKMHLAQTRAIGAARQWARNNGHIAHTRRIGFDKISVSFVNDPNNVAKRSGKDVDRRLARAESVTPAAVQPSVSEAAVEDDDDDAPVAPSAVSVVSKPIAGQNPLFANSPFGNLYGRDA